MLRGVTPAPRIAVIGAGAFGGWTALWLRRAGARVTLVDAWGAGNSRSSSGDDTRVIRAVYGPSSTYVTWVARALELWREHETRWQRPLLARTGALWMFTGDDSYARESAPLLARHGMSLEELAPHEAQRRWPQFALDDVRRAWYEQDAGYLRARFACACVCEAFVAEGGTYIEAQAKPGRVARGAMGSVALGNGDAIEADAYVFACGPWLGSLFPRICGPCVRSTRQEVFYFGTPAGDARFSEAQCPVWMHVAADGVTYGIPGNDGRGMKIADDRHGPKFDPSTGSRIVSGKGIKWARSAIAARFPSLAGAPLTESRVCQYENSPDGHLIIDRHPAARNAWIVGGGSGHGYKFGPALGEVVSALVLDDGEPDATYGIARTLGG